MKEIPIVVPPIEEQIKAIEHVKTQSMKIANRLINKKTKSKNSKNTNLL